MKKKEKKNDRSNAVTFQATIINIMNKQVLVQSDKEELLCILPGSLASGKNVLGIGDLVEVKEMENEQYKVSCVLPRKTEIYRGNRRSPGEDILIASNAQLLLVLVTANYLLNQAGYLEVAIIAARRAGVEIGVFVSKWDLIGESAQELLQDKIKIYLSCVDFVFTGSACERQENLIEKVKGKAVLVIGDRGCGKTSLINQSIQEQSEMKKPYTAPASTHAGVLKQGFDGTAWIDTPGFRDFALQAVTAEERNEVFSEIAEHSGNCYFRNCTHVYEDGCQVLEALRKKEIRRERYDVYQRISDAKEAPCHAPKIDYRHTACLESFTCEVCGTLVVPEGAGSRHRNHCPKCLSSIHVDNEPGDRASLCRGTMEPVSVWARKGGEWALIHRCKSCGALSSNRIAADDNPALLMSIAVKPLAATPFPLDRLEEMFQK
ncbi:ribosome small subunit-dependent GTPase A [Konateibacter massiliensis]|uniref:ribosome small subunit-dependent GTPase A n=1 Tax=Konateibacter massiliensis TaxID=2002841 RepID=UPI000C15922F|nr:ribosome small subunit-dependent GTPase A [Konateibacter massiliensis]